MQFDFIIVGAGSAGCVLAHRLSADPTIRVLLLEAGGDHRHFLISMPLGFLRAMLNPKFSRFMLSEPEPHLNQRRLPMPRGRVLGGSSSINGMFYMRGHSLDYETWEQMGCEGWGFAEVLPYFKRLECSWRGAGPYHGATGPLHVAPIQTQWRLHEPLIESAEVAGFTRTEDLHGPDEEGSCCPASALPRNCGAMVLRCCTTCRVWVATYRSIPACRCCSASGGP